MAPLASFSQALFVESKDFFEIKYRVIAPPASKKIAVLAFFSMEIAECAKLWAKMSDWSKSRADVELHFVHVSAGGMHSVSQRLFACLDTLNVGDKVFLALASEMSSGKHLASKDDALAIAKRLGVDPVKLSGVWDSEAVSSRVRRYDRLTSSYRVRSAPSFGVSDRFFVPARKDDILRVLDRAVEESKVPRKAFGDASGGQFISAPGVFRP